MAPHHAPVYIFLQFKTLSETFHFFFYLLQFSLRCLLNLPTSVNSLLLFVWTRNLSYHPKSNNKKKNVMNDFYFGGKSNCFDNFWPQNCFVGKCFLYKISRELEATHMFIFIFRRINKYKIVVKLNEWRIFSSFLLKIFHGTTTSNHFG